MQSRKWQLTLQSLSLVVGFMCWVILSSLMSKIKLDIPLTPNQTALVTAIPVILGSILRIPLGYWTNRLVQEICFLLAF